MRLGDQYGGLQFFATPEVNTTLIYVNGESISGLYTKAGNTWTICVSDNTNLYTINSSNQVIWDGKFLAYNGVIVLGSDTIVSDGAYTTIDQSASSGETWVLNEDIYSLPQGSPITNINFVSNNQNFTIFQFVDDGDGDELKYNDVVVYSDSSLAWTDEAYRTITFSTAPSGDLLTWLQANGTKQSISTPLNVDITTLAGYSQLVAGTQYSITVKAMATGYQDSDPSAAVSYTVPTSTKTLEAGIYKFMSGLDTEATNLNLTEVCSGKCYSMTSSTEYGDLVGFIKIRVSKIANRALTLNIDIDSSGHGIVYDGTDWRYVTEDDDFQPQDTNDLRTIFIESDQQVSEEFYNWAIVGKNLVKQTMIKAGTYKWVDEPSGLPSGDIVAEFVFTSNEDSYEAIVIAGAGPVITYSGSSAEDEVYDGDTWVNSNFKTITVADKQWVSSEFYDYAIAGGNLAKDTLEAGTYKWIDSPNFIDYTFLNQ